MASSAARRVTSRSSGTASDAPGGRQRSMRSHSRWPPLRPAIPTWPRTHIMSSMRETTLLLVQPIDSHGATLRSSISRSGSGPSARRRSRM